MLINHFCCLFSWFEIGKKQKLMRKSISTKIYRFTHWCVCVCVLCLREIVVTMIALDENLVVIQSAINVVYLSKWLFAHSHNRIAKTVLIKKRNKRYARKSKTTKLIWLQQLWAHGIEHLFEMRHFICSDHQITIYWLTNRSRNDKIDLNFNSNFAIQICSRISFVVVVICGTPHFPTTVPFWTSIKWSNDTDT